MKNKLRRYPLLTAFILGFLSVYALPPFFIVPILFVTFSGLVILLCTPENTAFSCWKIGYFFGFGYFAFGFSWIGNALLIDAQTFGWLYPIALLSCGAFFGLFTAFPAWLTYYFKTPLAKIFALSGLWGISEWFRSFFLTGFPWNLLGSALSFSPASMQSASLWGTYGMSIILILAASAPALCFLSRTTKNLLFAVGLPTIVLAFILAFGFWRLDHYQDLGVSQTRIRIVQPSIPQTLKWNDQAMEQNFARYISLSQSPGLEDIDFVIWGETASPYPLDMDSAHLQQITAAIPANGYLITGVVRYEGDSWYNYKPYNSMFVINKQAQILAHYDKSHLVPFGEYIPLRQYLPAWIKPVANTIANFKSGSGPKNIHIGNHPDFGTLICYEIIFPHQIINSDSKPKWLINLTNDGWYGESQGPYQHFAATRLRAVEEGISIFRVANSGISAGITPLGEIMGKIDLNQVGFFDFNLPESSSIFTIYNRYGNNIPLILSFLNIMIAFYITLHKF